ncbi:SGNH/GDSL hydrolase family protein [Rufibacter psychrotolerans]|uniref:SGNH/GDSL hydrolase family protein n=1 Tax=Rufibacter psychrotolerans TaxID=2812556 RepID=UPI00196788F0|nr:SGNH/GDSL hydrolase family protein [Rufibacter sp. SYSU D00308]
MKLFTIGDSISQGFMSMAAARTDLSYSSLIAEVMGLVPKSYYYPEWAVGGMPINLENLFRRLSKKMKNRIDFWEWPNMLIGINQFLDEVEDYYERGLGREDAKYDGEGDFYHNIAIRGFNVGDSWKLTSELCLKYIKEAREARDQVFAAPNQSFYRTALKVLNPKLEDKYMNFTQLDWLEKHSESDDGLENLFLWLGPNNALSTLLDMEIRQTRGDGTIVEMSYEDRSNANYNLWHPDDFINEYQQLIERVDAAMQKNKYQNWKVFVGNVPLITIAPFARGLGKKTKTDTGIYYDFYTYFPYDKDSLANNKHLPKLSREDVMFIDASIRRYNKGINKILNDLNNKYQTNEGVKRYFVIDVAEILSQMAIKRNNGEVKYDFPDYVKMRYPVVNTKYYQTDNQGRIKQGGIFSLDGVHPSAIGHGLLAYEFMRVMEKAGVIFSEKSALQWDKIYASDTLYSTPIPLVNELFEHDKLKEWIAPFLKHFLEK